MIYGILPVKHSNARYQAEAIGLAKKELLLLLNACGILPNAREMCISGVEVIAFEADALSPVHMSILSDHSLLYWLFEIRSDQSLLPVLARRPAALGEDLAYIQKYKGKTNERFTELLINMALYSSAFFSASEKLKLLDPMCGRGTTLFLGVNRGMAVTGADADRGEIAECSRFFKRYLEYHRIRHKCEKHARTWSGASIPMQSYGFDLPGGSRGELHLATVDARATRGLGKDGFHLMAVDLPYGVQHGPAGKGGLPALVQEAAPAWRAALRPGGAAALAFNTNTLSRDTVACALENAGFQLASGEAYEGLAHWVEQAVTRDIVVGIVPQANE